MARSIHTTPFTLGDNAEPGRVIRALATSPTDVKEPLPAVLVVHGFKGFVRWGFFPELQKRVAELGMISIAINLSGSGVGEDLESFTEDEAFFNTTPTRDLEDIERVRRFIGGFESTDVFPPIDPTRLALFGHSRGGGTVLLNAEQAGDYRAVVTWAAVSTTDRFGDEVKREWREKGVLEVPNARTGQTHRIGVGWLDDLEANGDALDIRAACRRSSTPTLLVHGTNDESVPYSEGLALKDAFRPGLAEFLSIEGAGHTFGAVHPFRGTTPDLETALDATIEFLDKCVLPRSLS